MIKEVEIRNIHPDNDIYLKVYYKNKHFFIEEWCDKLKVGTHCFFEMSGRGKYETEELKEVE